MNCIKIGLAAILYMGLSHNHTIEAQAEKPSQLIYYATHAAGAFVYAQAEKLVLSLITKATTSDNPFAEIADGRGAQAQPANSRISLLITLVHLYGLFKLPGLINQYIFKDTQERSTSKNLQSLTLRMVIPYPEIGAVVSEYLVDGHKELTPQAK